MGVGSAQGLKRQTLVQCQQNKTVEQTQWLFSKSLWLPSVRGTNSQGHSSKFQAIHKQSQHQARLLQTFLNFISPYSHFLLEIIAANDFYVHNNGLKNFPIRTGSSLKGWKKAILNQIRRKQLYVLSVCVFTDTILSRHLSKINTNKDSTPSTSDPT